NGYASLDGQTWSLLGSASLAITNPLYLGLSLSSHTTNRLTTARFRDLSFVTNGVVGAPVLPREPLGPSSRKTGLVISEIMYKPAPRTDDKVLEYVELFNSNPFVEDISGYRLSGAIYLEVPYSNKPPWPVAADGTGHSLVLARPSYGEGFAKAWDISDVAGGSPGAVESYRPSPLRSVLINEFLAHTDDPLLDYIELYNH